MKLMLVCLAGICFGMVIGSVLSAFIFCEEFAKFTKKLQQKEL